MNFDFQIKLTMFVHNLTSIINTILRNFYQFL